MTVKNQLHYAFMTSINYAYMCQSETMPSIIDFFSVNNKKVKTNNNITDNKDSNNNNKCVSVTVSENCNKKKLEKVLQTFYNLTPGLTFL